MPTPKASTSRKPPAPSESHAEIADWMGKVMPDLNPIVSQIDEQIRKLIPGLHYAIKWKRAYYGLPERGWIIELVAYDISVNIVFLAGADFPTPPPLGDTGRSRYIKIRTLDEAKAPEISAWIQQAALAPGWS